MSSQENAALYKMHKTSNVPVLLHRRGDHCSLIRSTTLKTTLEIKTASDGSGLRITNMDEVLAQIDVDFELEPLFGRVGDKLYGMPMKAHQIGRAPICEFCAHQFNCIGGRPPSTLKIEDLLPPTSREIIHQPEEGYPA